MAKLHKLSKMAAKFLRDIRKREAPFLLSDDLFSQKLGHYYFLFEDDPRKLNRLISSFDARGIPMNDAYVDVENPRRHYYPISIGQYALARFNRWISEGEGEVRDHFLRIADWFMESVSEDDTLGSYWLTDIPKPEYRVFRPWKSAFAQSRALSVLLRAWQMTGREEYLRTAGRALLPFEVDISEGGVAAFADSNAPIYEEYTAEAPTAVLDGHNFSLLGVFDFIRAVPESLDKSSHDRAVKIFEKGIEGLIQRLPDYDMGYWLRFNLCSMPHYPQPDPCSIGYYRLVLLQLELLHTLSGRDELIGYQHKFSGYDRPGNIMRMYMDKYRALKKMNRL